MSDSPEYSAIILAGGRSSRMGRPKAELPFAAGTMLDYIVAEMLRVFDDLVVAVAEPQAVCMGRHMARDRSKTASRIAARLSALEHALRKIEFDRAFVCSCDVPFVNGDLARRLCDMLGDDDVLIPHVDGKLQMLHAVYRKECAKILATHAQERRESPSRDREFCESAASFPKTKSARSIPSC